MNTRQAIQPSSTPNVLSIAYSCSRTRFVTGLSDGFRSFRTDNCLVAHQPGPGVGHAAVIAESLDDRYFAVVYRNKSKHSGPNVVVFWDAFLQRELISFDLHEPILGLRLTSRWMAVILGERTILFQYQELASKDDQPSGQAETKDEGSVRAPNLAHSIYPTSINTHALASLSNQLLVLPSQSIGQVQIITLGLDTARTKRVVKAHDSSLKCFALSTDDSLLATTSQQGTLIRVFSTKTTDQVAEFRRGMDHSIIYSLAFSPGNRFVASTSDKGTLHIFDLQPVDPTSATPAAQRNTEQNKHRKTPSNTDYRLSGGGGFDRDSLSGMSIGRSSPAPSTAIGVGHGTGYHGSVQEYYGLRPPPALASPPARDAAVSAIAALKSSPLMPRAMRDIRSVASAPFYIGNDLTHWQGGPAYSWTTTPNGTRKRVKNAVQPLPSDPSGRPPKGILTFAPSENGGSDDNGAVIYVIGGGSDARWEKFELLPPEPNDGHTPAGWTLVNRGFRRYLTRQFAD